MLNASARFCKSLSLAKTLLLVFFLSILVSGNVQSEILCENALLQRVVTKEIALPLKNQGSQLEEAPTVQISKAVYDQNGSELLSLKKIAAGWFSSYSDGPLDTQGDPRWITELVGSKIAHFLGFREIDSNTITVPTVAFLNAKLKLLNQYFQRAGLEQIEVEFYSQNGASDIEFLNKMSQSFAVPIASTGNMLIHDVSYHISSIILPDSLTSAVRANVSYFLKIREQVLSRNMPQAVRECALSYFDLLMHRIVTNFDIGLGNLPLIMTSSDLGNKSLHQDSYEHLSLAIDDANLVAGQLKLSANRSLVTKMVSQKLPQNETSFAEINAAYSEFIEVAKMAAQSYQTSLNPPDSAAMRLPPANMIAQGIKNRLNDFKSFERNNLP